MSEQHEPPSAKGRRRFLAALLVMVILAVAAGLALSRIRDAKAAADAATSMSAPASPQRAGAR